MTTGKTIALTRWTFVGKLTSLLFNMLSRLVIIFLPRSKHLLISWLQSPSAVILEPRKITSATVSTSICHEVMGLDAMIFIFRGHTVKQYLNNHTMWAPRAWYNDKFSNNGGCYTSFHYPKVQNVNFHLVGVCQRDIIESKSLKYFMIPTNAAKFVHLMLDTELKKQSSL